MAGAELELEWLGAWIHNSTRLVQVMKIAGGNLLCEDANSPIDQPVMVTVPISQIGRFTGGWQRV